MKNYKLIPLLAMTALLAGCGVNKGAKAPKFAKLGEEISAAELTEVVSSNDFLGAWTNGELETPSAKFVKKTNSQTNEKLYSNKKVISTRSYKDSAENSFELDMTSLRGKYSYTCESEENVKNQVITTKENEKEVTNTIYQFCNSSHTGEEKEYLIRANVDEKTFHVIADSSTATEEDKLEMFFDQVFSQTDFAFPYEFKTFPSSYEGLSNEQKREYKFYKNNSIYTIVCNGDRTLPSYDYSHTLISVARNKVTSKLQIDVTEGSTYKVSYECETNYRIDYLGTAYASEQVIKAGDYIEGKDVVYQETSVTASSEIKIEATDISGFVLD